MTNDFFEAPTTLRIPTSFARFSLRAVLMFIKLIHAINRINAAIKANSLTYQFYHLKLHSQKMEYKAAYLNGYKIFRSVFRDQMINNNIFNFRIQRCNISIWFKQ